MSIIELLLRAEAQTDAEVIDLLVLIWSTDKMDVALQEVEQ
jgi:hypothetical protein